jgi:hypothetical protein
MLTVRAERGPNKWSDQSSLGYCSGGIFHYYRSPWLHICGSGMFGKPVM